MPLARLSSKSQIVLPAEIRRHLKIHPGDTLEIREENQHIIISKPLTSMVEELDRCASQVWRNYEKELEQSRAEWDK